MSQLVYAQVPTDRPRCTGDPIAVDLGGALDRDARMLWVVMIGEIAQYDECEDECDPYTHVPVRYRGRVAAAPLAQIRPVL
ncbi:hypothetical protein ACWESM_18500 [Nocardia sp. NPDC003999]